MKNRFVALLVLLISACYPLKSIAETKLPEEPGTYPVTTSYTEDGKELKRTLYVTVKSPDTTIVGDTAIDAKAFVVTADQVEKLTAEEAISYSNAKAWSTIDGSEKVISTVDLSQVRPEEGTYEVTFSTREAVSRTVSVTVTTPLLGNRELNSYQSPFESSHWRFVLTLSFLLTLILLTPLLIVIFSSKNIVQVVNQLIEIFSK